MKTKTIVSFMFFGLILSACGQNSSESSEPISNSEEPTSQTSTPSTSDNEDPIVSPSIQLTVAPAYSGDFWDDADLTLTGTALRDELNDFMWADFNPIDYNTVSTAILEMDQDPNNASNILSLYDLNSIPKSQQNWKWNREHTFPQSKLADGDDSLRAGSTKKNISSDAANIFAADVKLNTDRSNFSFIDLDLEEKYHQYTMYNSFGTRTDNFIYRGYYAPTPKVRGEIARAQLYMLVMYPNNCSMSENFSLADMLRWNLEYAPTVERDLQRNAGLEKYQHMRNPFIDYPELGCQVFGDFNKSTRGACSIAQIIKNDQHVSQRTSVRYDSFKGKKNMKINRMMLLVTLLLLAGCGTSSSELHTSIGVLTSQEVSEDLSTSVEENNDFGGYYKDIDLDQEGTTLLNALKTLVNNTYRGGNYAKAWDNAREADEDVDNSNNIIQIYSRFTRPKSEKNSGSGTDNWNREHVVTQSAMGCNTSSIGPCTDYNNLFASDTAVNSKRGNTRFGVVSGGTIVKDSKGRNTPARIGSGVFDPSSEARGEVARATMYMIIKWNFSTSINGDFDTLLEWNRDYPPTEAREIKRNNAVQKYQNNRNPFIDYPYLADAIWAQMRFLCFTTFYS